MTIWLGCRGRCRQLSQSAADSHDVGLDNEGKKREIGERGWRSAQLSGRLILQSRRHSRARRLVRVKSWSRSAPAVDVASGRRHFAVRRVKVGDG